MRLSLFAPVMGARRGLSIILRVLLIQCLLSTCRCFVVIPCRSVSPLCRQRPSSLASQKKDTKGSVVGEHIPARRSRKLPKKSETYSSAQIPVTKPSIRVQLDFARKGHCVLRRAVDKSRISTVRKDLMKYAREQELLAWQQKVEVATQSIKRAQSCRSIEECRRTLLDLGSSPDNLPFLQFFNTWQTIPSVLELARSLAETASTLLDCESIRLYQDSLFWKRSGDGPTPWHTDGRMAPFDTASLVTFWIPLQNVPHNGSALVFCSKSHSDFALPYWNEYSKTHKDPESPWNRLYERYGGDKALEDYMPMSVGDVTAHSGWILHCADPVPSGVEDRVALAVSFVDSYATVRSSLKGTAKTSAKDAGDPEDAWSYRRWINEVPSNQPNFQHELVPILYPSHKR